MDYVTPSVFYILAVLSVFSALVVVFARSPMRCALGLLFTFLGLAGLYVLLRAHLIAVIQVLVYAGGVTVLFAFVVMMMRQGQQMRYPGPFMPVRLLSVITVFYLLYVIGPVVFEAKKVRQELGADYGTVKLIGEVLFSKYVVAFEATGLLLLMTMVAAVALLGGGGVASIAGSSGGASSGKEEGKRCNAD